MADLSDLASEYSSNEGGTEGKANLLDYASDYGTQEELTEQAPQEQMISQDDVSTMARDFALEDRQKELRPGIAGIAERDRQAVTEAGIDPELIFEGNAEKFGKSLVAGVGIVVNDIGNMIDYTAMTILPDEVRKSDTFLRLTERLPNFHEYGDALQKWGEVHQSPGLDEFTLDDMFKIEFWATDVAKTLPYMAAMLIPGAAGARAAGGLMTAGARHAAKKGLFGSAKRLTKTLNSQKSAKAFAKGSSKGVAGAEAALGGEGLMGALATTAEGKIALSSLGSGIAQFLGAGTGTTAVIGAGLSGDVYNRAIDMGLTEEEAQEAAHGTFVDNSKWFALNGLSWGIQFGGLSGRAFKQFNRMKGGAESAKVIQKTFGQRLMSHAQKGIVTGTLEGTEEMFQETYEEWIQQKNLAEVQGKEFVGYTDFLTSDENRKTLGVSFAAGFLMGGRGGFMDSVAENGRRITNKRVSIDNDINMYENMNDAQKKVRTNEIIEAAIREDQVDGLNGMLDKLQKAGKISAEERAEYDATIVEYSEIAATLPFKEKLTEAGQITLFNIKVKQLQSEKSLKNLNVLKERSVAEANENLEGEALTKELSKIEAEHNMNVAAVEKSIAEGKQGVAKLLASKKYSSTGKKVDTDRLNEIKSFEQTEDYAAMNDAQKAELFSEKAALEDRIKEDSYAVEEANESVEALTQEEYEQFTKAGETEKAERQKTEAEEKVEKVSDAVEEGAEKAKEAGEGFVSKAKTFAGKAMDFVKQKFTNRKKQAAFRKVMRPLDDKIQELKKEGKTTEEIVKDKEFRRLVIESLNKDQESLKEIAEITDEELTSYIDTVTDAKADQEVKDAESDEEAEARSSKDEATEESKVETDEDTTTEDEAESGEEAKQKKAQPSDKKPKAKTKTDADLTYAQGVKKSAEKIAKFLSKKVSQAKKAKAPKAIKNLLKDGFGTVPGGVKKMKVDGKTVEAKAPSVLQYYSSINPALESSIIGAASKKFPTKQLLILREVIDEHGQEVAGMALGSAVHVQAGSDVGVKIMHEYAHVYYAIMKDNPSFKRGVAKIINSKIFRDIKNRYSEELMYEVTIGGKSAIQTGNNLFWVGVHNKSSFPKEIQETIEAWAEAHENGDQEVTKVMYDKYIVQLQETGEVKILPDSKQDNIIEESFVTSLAPQMAGKLNILFDKGPDVVQYEGFLKRLKGRVAKLITPKDAKEILKNVDSKFENMSLEEIGSVIIDDISTGVDGGKFKTGKAKYMKFGKLSKEIGAAASIEINKVLRDDTRPGFDKAVDLIVDNIAEELNDPDIKDKIREEVEYRYAAEINTRNGYTLDPDKANSPGVKRIYDTAGYNSGVTNQEGDNTVEDDYSSEVDEYIDGNGEQDVNVMSSDSQKQLALDNSSSHLIKAVLMIANPQGKNRQYDKSKLESEIYKLAFANRNRPSYFISAMKKSGDPHIVKLMEILDELTEPTERLAILREFHNNYRNKFLESIAYTTINSDGNIVESEAIASRERKKIDRITNAANSVFFGSKGADVRTDIVKRIQAAQAKLAKGQSLTMPEALKIVAPILFMSDNSQYLNMDALVNIRVSTKGKQLGLPAFVESWISSKLFNEYIPKGKVSIKSPEFKSLIENMVVASRTKNFIKTVTNVEGKSTSVANMNSHLLNQKQSIEDKAKTEEGRLELLEKYPGNPLIKMVVALGAQGLEQEAFKLSIDGGTLSYTGSNSRSVAYQNKTKEDIFFGDLEHFVSARMKVTEGDKSLTYYSQPIAIFSSSKRRYSIQVPMVITKKQLKQAVDELELERIDNSNKMSSKKYADDKSVIDVSKKAIQDHADRMAAVIKANPGVLTDNPVLSNIASIVKDKVVISDAGMKMLKEYSFNFTLNSTYAQELFVGSHEQSKSEADYIKRATGAIARHDGSLRGVAIEPIVFEDVEVNGVESTDAASFILPEDVEFIQSRVGPKMGHLYKFVYYGSDKRGDKANPELENEDVYLKTAVHVLTPEMIGKSVALQNIADKLRDRRKKNGYGESLNIAIFESGAKKFPSIHNGQKSITHNADFGVDSDAQQQLNDAYMVGDKLVGIDGANMGIQLTMDKGRKTTAYPTQLVGSNNNDLTSEQALEMDQIQVIEAEIFDANLEEAVGALIADQKESTPESRLKVKQILGKVVGNNAITSTSNGAAKLLAAANDNISQNLPGLHKYFGDAIKSLIRKSAKIVTNGTIAYQATSVGKDLKSYTKGLRYNSNQGSRKVTLPAEAVVPASLKGKYLARVDKDFNSMQELKSYIDRNMVKIGSSKQGGIRIEGLDRVWDSELEAKEFLYSQMAQLEDGRFVILGEEFIGSRIPAHGNQSRVVMEITGFQTEVKGKDGSFQNNAIQIPSDVNKVLGSDHDGDSIFMNFRHDNPRTASQRRVNSYVKKTIDFYQKEGKFQEITADLDISTEIDGRMEAVNKRFPSRNKRSSQNTPLGAAEFFEENVKGSGMVGNVAALNNGMSYMARYGVRLGFPISIDGTRKEAFNNDWSGDYATNSLTFQGAKTLQVVLDNAKNQQATVLGLNPSTIVAGSILPRIGFNPSQVDLILNSQGAKLYAKHAGRKAMRDRNSSYTSAAEAALTELLGKKGEKQAKIISSELAKNPDSSISINTDLIKDGQVDKHKAGDQARLNNEIEIIRALHKLEGVGQDVYTLNGLLGQHKVVPTNRQEAREMNQKIDDLFNEDASVKGEQALNGLAANPVVASFRKRLNSTEAIYSKNQITGTKHADETFDTIKQMVGGNALFRSFDGDQAKILNDYMLNIIMNFSPKISNAIGKYAKSKDGEIVEISLMERLDRFHRESLASEENNEFLNAIVIRRQEGFKDADDKFSLSLNRDYINENTRPFEIEAIKKDFARLPSIKTAKGAVLDIQEMFLAADAILNGGGLTNSSVSLLFDNNTLISISKSIDSKHQEILSEIPGAIADANIVAEAIVIENPEIVSTAKRFFFNKATGKIEVTSSLNNSLSGSFGDQELKLINPKTDIQRDNLRANKPHYIKTQYGTEFAIYKWVPTPASKFDADNYLTTSRKHGKYVLVGRKKKGTKTKVSNLKKMERQAKTGEALSSLIINDSSIPKSSKMKMNNTRSGGEQGFTDTYEQFTFEEYLADKGYTIQEISKNKSLREALDKLYRQYQSNFNLAQEFDRNIVQTGKLSNISEGRLTDYALLFQKLDPSAISGAHRSVVLELAKRAGEQQKASRNGIEWTDKGDISWLHAWFGSNNIAGNRPEIQKLVREMEKEYDNFMDENIKFQTELDRLTKNLVRDRMSKKGNEKVWDFVRWFAGSFPERLNSKIYKNMYDKKISYINGKEVPELKLKTRSDFLKTKPSKAEREFYNFFVDTTTKYGKITKSALGERFKSGYIPHLQTSLKESMRQRGLFGLYDYMLQGTGDIDGVRVKGTNPITNKTEIMAFHEWKYLYYTEKGVKGRARDAFKGKNFKSVAKLDIIRKRAEKLAKSGKHEDGKPISRTEQEIHGMMGTNLMSRFTRSRGVKAAMFGSQDLGKALSQYVNTTLFTYGNENFKGFKSMTPLLDGVIRYNKQKGNKNAVTYLENVWKKGFYSFKESQTGLGRLTDTAIHKLVTLTRLRYLTLGFSGGFGNLVIGKYNEFRSKGGKNFARGEKRYWGERKKAWAVIKKNLNPERFAYDLIQGNKSTGLSSILMSPYIGSEHYIQGSGLVSQFTEEEWNRIGEDGEIPADLKDKVALYVDNVTRQQGYGYSKADQIGIATYSWGKAIMQFKKWMPTAISERFQKETIDRFGEMRAGSNATAFAFGADFARGVMSGEESVADFRKRFKGLPEHKKEAVRTFFRGMQVVSALTALSMMFGDSDDDELRGFARWADDSVDDIMFMTDPRRIKYLSEPASWGLVESASTMAVGMATLDRAQFKGGLTGISWTASQVLSSGEQAVKELEN